MFKAAVILLLLLIALPTVTPILVGAGIISAGIFVNDYSVYIFRFFALVFVLWVANRNKDKIHAFFNKGK